MKRVLWRCIICKRYEGGLYRMFIMLFLFRKRVNEFFLFIYIGVDYFGLIYVKIDGVIKKVWVCLFICLVVRVIYLEFM